MSVGRPREALIPARMPRARLATTAGRARLAGIALGHVALTVAIVEAMRALAFT